MKEEGLVTIKIVTPADGEVITMLCTVTPDRYISYFRELGEATKATGKLEPAQIIEIMGRYATEPYRPPVS